MSLLPSLRADFDIIATPESASAAGRSDARALDHFGIETALKNHVLPLQPAGAARPVACASRADFRRLEPHLRARFGHVVCREKPRDVIEAALGVVAQAAE